MKPRSHSRVFPYKQLRVQASTDTVCFTGMMRDISYAGSCICIQTTEDLPVYVDNRLLIRCQLKHLNEIWADELLVGRVRWIKKQQDETVLGVEFLDTDEYYHPRISSLRSREDA
ncbi:MAG: PilZ domain-containing protein [Nitrospirae bacterium]|nr:PilZ domain-containing protein [Nitrospirota bacterium]